MSDLAEFLLARIAEDEVDGPRHADWCTLLADSGLPCDCNGAARVLADVEAKRRIVEEHSEDRWFYQSADALPHCSTCAVWDEADHDGPPTVQWPCPTLRLLALPYADHPDVRPEWLPDA